MMLNLQSVSAAYGKAVALESVTLHIKAGELVAILGPNGAGKSTLLKVISRSLNAQGTLEFEGRSLHDFSTVHGAWLTGLQAAADAMATLRR